MALRTNDVARARRAVAKQFDLVDRGVFLEEGSNIAYTSTRLNAITPEMVAEATRDARASAAQLAQDSGADAGRIRRTGERTADLATLMRNAYAGPCGHKTKKQ